MRRALLPGRSAARLIDWSIRDPIGESASVYRAVATQIEGLVMRLILELSGVNAPRTLGLPGRRPNVPHNRLPWRVSARRRIRIVLKLKRDIHARPGRNSQRDPQSSRLWRESSGR